MTLAPPGGGGDRDDSNDRRRLNVSPTPSADDVGRDGFGPGWNPWQEMERSVAKRKNSLMVLGI